MGTVLSDKIRDMRIAQRPFHFVGRNLTFFTADSVGADADETWPWFNTGGFAVIELEPVAPGASLLSPSP